MTLTELKSEFKIRLSNLYPSNEIDSFYYLTINHYLNLKRTDIALNPSLKVVNELEKITDTIKKLEKEVPIQYILGKTEFYGLPIKVNKHVLIPRPETEELVDWIIKDVKLKNQLSLNILDIGTGSGCIPISLAKNINNSQVTSIDISKEAITVAQENAELNKVAISFIERDILTTNKLDASYDVIVSNPPYVRELEKTEIKNNVLEYEPHLALFVEDDQPLIFYKKVAELALKHLNKNGCLYLEINQYLAKETVELLKSIGFENIELKKDIFGNDRIIRASID